MAHTTTSHAGGACTFCGAAYRGRPNRCSRCGTLLNDAVEDVRRAGSDAKLRIHHRRTLADLFFLVGLLLGGPMMTVGGDGQTGLFIVLAGGLASVLRRYTEWSAVGTLVAGSVAAAIGAALVMEPVDGLEATASDPEARGAYAEGLSAPEQDLLVEARGPSLITVWFTVPPQVAGECGAYPRPEVRAHLADLGFRRVVVTQRNQSGGLCSFAP